MDMRNDDGSPYDVTGLTITCGLRNAKNTAIATLTLDPSTNPGRFLIQAPTDSWPLGRLTGDFRIVSGSVVLYSSTFGVTVTEEMTPAPPP